MGRQDLIEHPYIDKMLSPLGAISAHAQDATWVGGNGGDPNEWQNNNWSPATIPTGTATFNTSAVTSVTAAGWSPSVP